MYCFAICVLSVDLLALKPGEHCVALTRYICRKTVRHFKRKASRKWAWPPLTLSRWLILAPASSSSCRASTLPPRQAQWRAVASSWGVHTHTQAPSPL